MKDHPWSTPQLRKLDQPVRNNGRLYVLALCMSLLNWHCAHHHQGLAQPEVAVTVC